MIDSGSITVRVKQVTPAQPERHLIPRSVHTRVTEKVERVVRARRVVSRLAGQGDIPLVESSVGGQLAVLGGCVAAEPRQLDLLDRICAGRLISVADLAAGGVLPVQGAAKLTTVDEGRIPRLF
ncbi:hypothetical protein [Micromonospora sp. 050-3]|uniref:hypothetical protein n=1 Tax=Micromonospora sp. 050-3 TaxID=2789265 RepID=UPI00397DCC4B